MLQRFEIARNWKSISSVQDDDDGRLVLKEKRKRELLERFGDILDPQFVYEIEHIDHGEEEEEDKDMSSSLGSSQSSSSSSDEKEEQSDVDSITQEKQ